MSRSTNEWVGKSDDVAILLPSQARCARAGDLCVKCDRKGWREAAPRVRSHRIPLDPGGKNRESNSSFFAMSATAQRQSWT